MNRIRKNYEFRRVYRWGTSNADRHMVVYRRKNGQPHNYYGYSISKKVGKSVVRNKIKRRLREIARGFDGYLVKGFDYVIIARKDSVNADFEALKRSYIDLVTKLGGVKVD